MIDKSSLPTTITNNTVNTYIDANIETNNSSNFHITNINTLSEMLITQLILLSETSDEYKGLKEKFQYERPLKNSDVRYILKLEMPSKLTKSHKRYKKIIARLNNLSVDEVTRSAFHGTFTAYNPLCESGCGMCGIIRQGNKTKCSKHKSLFSSRKMWFATDPNTSLYFCTSNNSLKTMFVVDVISKKPKHIYVTNKEKATLPRYLILFEYKHQDIYA
ncbi:7748_t:CDS:2 [Entrophospora sp. SA101]|nr:7748_t:CDS:2 [Entrophospora sp. SA101]